MKCSNCGQVKPDYHFFSFRGKYDSAFFANPQALNGQCWGCNAPYRCISCGNVQTADQFRIHGRICVTCKTVGISKVAPVEDEFLAPLAYEDSLDAENSVESGDLS